MIGRRTRNVGIAVSALAITGTGVAAYAATGPKSTTISACVAIKSGAIRLETAKHPCTTGPNAKHRERRLVWDKTGAAGPAGVAGAAGTAGAAGKDGLDGTMGPAGPTGAAGPIGPAGATGAPGVAGSIGPVGATGPTGAQGPTGATGAAGVAGADGTSFLQGTVSPSGSIGNLGDTYLNSSNGSLYLKTGSSVWALQGNVIGPTGAAGAPGATGATGPTGAAGSGTIFAASSIVSMTTIAGGLAGQGALLPLSGVLNTDAVSTQVGATIDTTVTGSHVPQSVPRATTVTGMSGFFSLSQAMSLVGTTVTVAAQLYQSTAPSNTFTPVPGAMCTFEPALTGVLAIGTISTCEVSGLSIPVPAGTRLMTVLEATAAGLTLSNTISGSGSVSITTS